MRPLRPLRLLRPMRPLIPKMPRARQTLGALALAVTLTLVGCAAPKIDLRRAELTKLTTKGLQLGIKLSVLNPNNYTIPLKNLGWRLDLFNNPFTSGAINLNKQIAANRTTPVDFSIPALFSRAAIGIQRFVAGQNIPWGFEGKANFQTPIGPVHVQFADRGVWPNPLKGLDLRRLGIVQAELPQDDMSALAASPARPLTLMIALGQSIEPAALDASSLEGPSLEGPSLAASALTAAP